jgi:hypothetical protein
MSTTTKKKMKTWQKVVWMGIGLFIIIGIVAVATDDGKENAQVKSASTKTGAVKKGETLHTEYFDYKINRVYTTDGIIIDGVQDLKKEEGNKYLVIDLTVKNTDKESRVMFDGIVIRNDGSQEYKYEQSETVLEDGWGFILDNINPGVTKQTKVVYKIPADATGTFDFEVGRGEGRLALCKM